MFGVAGRMQAPAFAARCMKKSPAQTRHSLFASATVAPRSTAASAGFNPAAPLTAAITQSAGRDAASIIALSPAPHSVRVPASASFNRETSGIGDSRETRAEFFRQLRQPLHIAVCGQRFDPVTVGAALSKSIVLSPIDPVAPRTVTVRTADAAALLLRNGTGLMNSPNHKTAADAIHAAPQKTEKCRQHHRGDESVETIHQSAMPGNDMAGILDAETPFHRGFKEIAELGSNGQNRSEHRRAPF